MPEEEQPVQREGGSSELAGCAGLGAAWLLAALVIILGIAVITVGCYWLLTLFWD